MTDLDKFRDTFSSVHQDGVEERCKLMQKVVESEADVDEKLATLESFLSVTEELLQRHPGMFDRHAASALEGHCPGILPSRYPPTSFTVLPTKTNYAPAMESISGKAIAMIVAAIAAIIGLILALMGKSKDRDAKFSSVISNSKDAQSKEDIETVVKAAKLIQEHKDIQVIDDTGVQDAVKEIKGKIATDRYYELQFANSFAKRAAMKGRMVDLGMLKEIIDVRPGVKSWLYPVIADNREKLFKASIWLLGTIEDIIENPERIVAPAAGFSPEEVEVEFDAILGNGAHSATGDITEIYYRILDHFDNSGVTQYNWRAVKEMLQKLEKEENAWYRIPAAFNTAVRSGVRASIEANNNIIMEDRDNLLPRKLLLDFDKMVKAKKALLSLHYWDLPRGIDPKMQKKVADRLEKIKKRVEKGFPDLGVYEEPYRAAINMRLQAYAGMTKTIALFEELLEIGIDTINCWDDISDAWQKYSKDAIEKIEKEIKITQS